MAIYEVKFKRVACTQGNWDGTVEPIVTVSAESAENAAIVAERRLFEDAERDPRRQFKSGAGIIASVTQLHGYAHIDWQEDPDAPEGDPETDPVAVELGPGAINISEPREEEPTYDTNGDQN